MYCCFLLADSIYGICRERRENLNIPVSGNYSGSKQLLRKPAKLCQPDDEDEDEDEEDVNNDYDDDDSKDFSS